MVSPSFCLVCLASAAHSPKRYWELGLSPLQVGEGGPKDSVKCLSGFAIEFCQNGAVGRCVNSSQVEHDLWQCKARSKQAELYLWVFNVWEQGGYPFHLGYLHLEQLCLVPSMPQGSSQECDAETPDPWHSLTKRIVVA